jgi:protein TonB
MSAALHGQDSRVFRYAVGASIALHGLMLLGLSMQDASRRAAAPPAPIVARLVQPPSAPAAAKPEAVAPAPVEKPPPAVGKPAPPTKPLPAAKAAPKAPSSVPAPAAPAAPTPPAPPAAEPAPAAPAAQSAPGAPAAPAAAPQVAAPAAQPGADDTDNIGRFRLQVIAATSRFKRYPRVAMDNNWEGRAHVRVSFGADGGRTSIVVVRSSGHEILDKQAIDMVAKTFVPVPPALRGKEFAFEFPVDFNLKDARSG